MPLTWDSTTTALDLDNEDDQNLKHVAIYATMAVGINHITFDNALDFYKRVSFWEKVNGAYRHRVADSGEGVENVFFSPEDVVRLIGLRTNASPKTKTQFNKSVWDAHDRWNVPFNFKMPFEILDGVTVV